MGGISIADINILYDSLILSTHPEEDPNSGAIMENKKIAGGLFEEIDIPEGRRFQFYLNLEKSSYSGVMTVFSKDISDFSGFAARTKKRLKERTKFQIHEMSDELLFLKYPKDNFFSYGVRVIDKEEPTLSVAFGSRGLAVKTMRNRSEFVKTISDLETIANITFYPYLQGKDVPKNILYYLNPV